MRAKTVNENYPLGAKSDPDAPWNEKEDDSDFELEMDGNELLIKRRYNRSAEDEWDEDEGYIDLETFAIFAARKLDINAEEKWDNEEYLDIQGIADSQNGFEFQTNWGTFEASMDELVDMTDLL